MKSASVPNMVLLVGVAAVMAAGSAIAIAVLVPNPPLVIIALCAAASLLGFLSLTYLARLNATLKDTSHILSLIIKGNLDRRVQPVGEMSDIGIMQHRINNLLDIVDVHARGDNAMIDEQTDGEYFQKVKASALMEMLNHAPGVAPVAKPDVPAQEAPAVPAEPLAQTRISVSVQAAVGEAVSSMNALIGNIQQATDEFISHIEVNGTNSTGIIEASRLARHNVETVAAAAEELTYSINEISERVMESSRIADQAVEHARKSNAIVNGLNEASDKIGDVVRLITDIAGQTNLLALNATIEATRAGEAGRGFAVVASEVKNLADQTASATEEIAEQINTIQQSTGSAVAAIQEIGKTINQISEISTAIAAAVEEQGAATGEISRNIQQAAGGTQEVSESIEKMGAAMTQTSTIAHDVQQYTNKLAEHTAVLEAQINHNEGAQA